MVNDAFSVFKYDSEEHVVSKADEWKKGKMKMTTMTDIISNFTIDSLVSSSSISDRISVLTFICTLIGGLFALYQWILKQKVERANGVKQLIDQYRQDNDIVVVTDWIDYGTPWYNASFHGSGDKEKKVDKTLFFFNYICYLKKRRILSSAEWFFFCYDIDRILSNWSIQDYLYNLYHFTKKQNILFPYEMLLKYARQKHFLKNCFFDASSCDQDDSLFHHYLNF